MQMVYIIDDQLYIRRLLHLGLEENGFSVREFSSGKELLNYTRDYGDTEDPKIILLDIMMPEMDGFEVLSEVMQHDQLKSIPVVMISARNQKEDVLKALKMGAKDFIVKPFVIEKVVQKIQNLIS